MRVFLFRGTPVVEVGGGVDAWEHVTVEEVYTYAEPHAPGGQVRGGRGETGYESGYGYSVAPYGTAYRRTLHTTGVPRS